VLIQKYSGVEAPTTQSTVDDTFVASEGFLMLRFFSPMMAAVSALFHLCRIPFKLSTTY
jgi:hypothetical protein